MFWLQRLNLHSGLMKRMGRALGVDFGDAVASGELRPEALRAAVVRCAACTRPGACDRWLEAHGDEAGCAPEWCGNAAMIAELAEHPEKSRRV